MKKIIVCLVCLIACKANAQSIDPVSLIIAKVIKAIDLQVQKLQNQTIWLQQAQQVMEHELSKAKLAEITDWQNKQVDLYERYFKELNTVKCAVSTLPQVKQIITMQSQVLQEYGRLAKDPLLLKQYDDALYLSRDILKTLNQLITTNALSVKDADRILSITSLRDEMEDCLDKIKQLNKEQTRLAAGKAQSHTDLQLLQQLNRKP